VLLSVTDVSSDAFGGAWGHTRYYRNRMTQDYDYGNGFNWLVEQWPYLIDRGSNQKIAVRPGQGTQWYKEQSGNYKTEYGAKTRFDETGGVYRVKTPGGSIEEYADPATSGGMGRLQRKLLPNGDELAMVYGLSGTLDLVVHSISVDDQIFAERYSYKYFPSGDQAGRLQSVTLERRLGSSGPWYQISRAIYEYYGPAESFGVLGDLKTATRQSSLGPNQWIDEASDYYRYYEGNVDEPGFVHGLKYAFGSTAVVRLREAFVDPFSASDDEVAPYADYYFEYDDQQRVSQEIYGGTRRYSFEYEVSSNPKGPNSWKYKTTETRPDNSRNIIYMNHVGQTMLREHHDLDENGDVIPSSRSVRYQKLGEDIDNNQYSAVEQAESNAVDINGGPTGLGYDPAEADLAVVLYDTQGLIRKYEYFDSTTLTSSESSENTPADLANYLKIETWQKGSATAQIKLREWRFETEVTSDGAFIHPIEDQIAYTDLAGMVKSITSFDYDYYPDTVRIWEKRTTLPAIDTAQNGPGTSPVRKEHYDFFGNMTWEQGPRGFIDYFKYDLSTGARIQMIEDVDSAILPYPEEPTEWTRPSGLPAPLHLVTDYQIDNRGRTTRELGPAHLVDGQLVRRARWTVYHDAEHEVWTAQGYVSGEEPYYVSMLVNPVSILRTDASGRPVDEIQAVRESTEGGLCRSNRFPQSTWCRWTQHEYDNSGKRTATRVYHTIPTDCEGKPRVNYDETTFGYDVVGRQNRVLSPGGTITRTVFDSRRRVVGVWVGTNDYAATDADPSGNSHTANNMRQVTEKAYEIDCDCGQPATVTQYVDDNSANDRVTTYEYDERNLPYRVYGELDFFQESTFDNLGRTVKVEQKDGGPSGTLLSRNETFFDARGNVYRTLRYAVNPSNGTVGNYLEANNWFDAADNVIKQVAEGAKDSRAFSKFSYDSQGRKVGQYFGYYDGDDDPIDDDPPDEITAENIIFEQSTQAYDAGGNVIQVTSLSRHHNATEGGPLVVADGENEPAARPQHIAIYYDPIGRQMASAVYGTNGYEAFTRPESVPARSDTTLVTSRTYSACGQPVTVTDPAGMVTRTDYDDAGRQIRTVTHDTGGCAGNSENVTVEYGHNADGNLATLTAVNPSTGNQVTQYQYGTSLNDSSLASSQLLRATVYPDSASATDRVVQSYNRQGEVTGMTDQNGTVHAYLYDLRGRLLEDRVTTLGTNIDGAVRRLVCSYEVRGLLEKFTSTATSTGGTVVNEIQYAYNHFQQLETEYQAHGGAVNTSETPKVQYYHLNGSSNSIRPTAVTYPNGRQIGFDYGVTSGDKDDLLSRVSTIVDDPLSADDPLAVYTYLGASTSVRVEYGQPEVRWDLILGDGDASDLYNGLDRFNRVVDCAWLKGDDSELENIDRIQYGYDRASNRTGRVNLVPDDANSPVDELYLYDGLQRLAQVTRGVSLSGTNLDYVNEPQQTQRWELDATGNWSRFQNFVAVEQASETTWVDQRRTSNRANEITGLTTHVGYPWAESVYDRAGNTTLLGLPFSPGIPVEATYDAWNRLATTSDFLISTGPRVMTYRYDGVNRRVSARTQWIEAGTSVTRHSYYNSGWQLLEERVDSSTNADRQFVWGLRYIDDLILRDRDTDANGSLNERLYALQDANWNVISITNTSGEKEARFRYDAYGRPSYFNGTNFPYNGTGWEILYAGYRYEEQGWYYVRNRYLDPMVGAWLMRDPLYVLPAAVLANSTELNEGNNLYRYVRGMPLTYIDPMGTETVTGRHTAEFGPSNSGTIDFEYEFELLCHSSDFGQSMGGQPVLNRPAEVTYSNVRWNPEFLWGISLGTGRFSLGLEFNWGANIDTQPLIDSPCSDNTKGSMGELTINFVVFRDHTLGIGGSVGKALGTQWYEELVTYGQQNWVKYRIDCCCKSIGYDKVTEVGRMESKVSEYRPRPRWYRRYRGYSCCS